MAPRWTKVLWRSVAQVLPAQGLEQGLDRPRLGDQRRLNVGASPLLSFLRARLQTCSIPWSRGSPAPVRSAPKPYGTHSPRIMLWSAATRCGLRNLSGPWKAG